MYRILPLLCDIGLGILAALGVEWALGLPFSWFHVGVGIVFAFLLDADVLVDKDLWRDGYVATHEESPSDHRELLHKPLLWLAAFGASAFILPPDLVLIAGSATFLHFVHDSMGTGFGIMWLWPFSMRSYKFFAAKDDPLTFKNFMISWSKEELPEVIRKHGMKEWIPRFYLRLTWISGLEYAVFLLGVSLLIFLRGILLV